MMTRVFPVLALLALSALAASCSEAPVTPPLDGGVRADALSIDDALAVDAPVMVLDAPVPPGTDAPMVAPDAPVAPGTDAPTSSIVDGGVVPSTDAPVASDAPPVTLSLCFNGFIDPGEVCDPGVRPDGGFPAEYAACRDCTAHECGTGAIDMNRCVGWTSLPDSCGPSFPGIPLLSWADATERNRLFSLLRSLLLVDGRTEVSGRVSLRHFGAFPGGAWDWINDPSNPLSGGVRLATDLPPWRERFPVPGMDCAGVSLTATGAVMYQAICGSGISFCLVPPPGTPR